MGDIKNSIIVLLSPKKKAVQTCCTAFLPDRLYRHGYFRIIFQNTSQSISLSICNLYQRARMPIGITPFHTSPCPVHNPKSRCFSPLFLPQIGSYARRLMHAGIFAIFQTSMLGPEKNRKHTDEALMLSCRFVTRLS